MPFEVAERDGVLTLRLDTPGSPINVFNHATARQLVDILAQVTPSTTRAIVFETAKSNSFINGVGLLLAQAARNDEDIVRASTPPWTAYRMVRDAPVPTIAVVEGNCFGCGVEFVLGCDHRLAADTWETQFYMTELNDYLFIPLFGSTWNLPEAVGLADAIDLLLWGERWDGSKAFARGLVDEVAPHEQIADRSREFVQRVLAGRQRSRRRGRISWSAHEDGVMERARRRIASLPPPYQRLYGEALALLESGARQTHGYLEQQKRELAGSGASALSAAGKAAYGFFYLRQVAAERASGRARGGAPGARLTAEVAGDDEASAFVDDLRSRSLRGVSFGAAEGAAFRLVSAARPASAAPAHRAQAGPGPLEVAVRTGLAAGPQGEVEIYAPAYRAGGRLVELAAASDDEVGAAAEAIRTLARVLQRLGFEVARTSPRGSFVSTRLVVAYLVPLVRFVEQGGSGEVANETLRRAGFVRLPAELVAALDAGRVSAQVSAALSRPASEIRPLVDGLATRRDGVDADETLIEALCLSLAGAVVAAREQRQVRDPTITDLVARELLDFPRHLCSLATWLRRARVAEALAHDRARSLVTETAVEAAAGFVAAGRELYR